MILLSQVGEPVNYPSCSSPHAYTALAQQGRRGQQLGDGSRTIYKTAGDGMGGRKVIPDDDYQSGTRGAVEQLGGGSRTIYRTQGDGMGGRKVVAEEEAPAAAPRTLSTAKKAELGYDTEESSDLPKVVPRAIYKTQGDGMGGRKAAEDKDIDIISGGVEQLGGGSRTIYRTQGDGMGGRKVSTEEESQDSAPRAMSAAKRAELGYVQDEQEDSAAVEQLAGGGRTIYKTQGDGMGGRKGVTDEEPQPKAPRANASAKEGEMYHDESQRIPGKVEQLGGGEQTIYKTQGDGMGGRKGTTFSLWGGEY